MWWTATPPQRPAMARLDPDQNRCVRTHKARQCRTHDVSYVHDVRWRKSIKPQPRAGHPAGHRPCRIGMDLSLTDRSSVLRIYPSTSVTGNWSARPLQRRLAPSWPVACASQIPAELFRGGTLLVATRRCTWASAAHVCMACGRRGADN